MPNHRAEEGDVLAAMTTVGFEFAREIAKAEGIDIGLTLMGDPADSPATAVLLKMPPGHVLDRHAHATHRVEVVVSGSVILPDGRVMRPGDVSISQPNEFYGPLTAGEEGSLSVEIFASSAGLAPIPADDEDTNVAALADKIRTSLEA
jgi:hypothetical protein